MLSTKIMSSSASSKSSSIDMNVYAGRPKKILFLPCTRYEGLQRTPRTLAGRSKSEPKKSDFIRPSTALKATMRDAETGEALEFTRSKWTSREGRLNLSAQMIVDMGTGRLDISKKSKISEPSRSTNKLDVDNTVSSTNHVPSLVHSSSASSTRNSSSRVEEEVTSRKSSDMLTGKHFDTKSRPKDGNSNIVSESELHPLVEEFLKVGPLTPLFHINWNPVTNNINSTDDSSYFSDDDFIGDELASNKQSPNELLEPENHPRSDISRHLMQKHDHESIDGNYSTSVYSRPTHADVEDDFTNSGSAVNTLALVGQHDVAHQKHVQDLLALAGRTEKFAIPSELGTLTTTM